MKVCLHIGFPRTGTTALEIHLFRKAENLHYLGELQRGPLRPIFEVDILSKDRIEFDAESTKSRTWNVIRSLAELDDSRTLLFSNHSLVFNWRNHVDRVTVAERLRSIFGDASIGIVIRHQRDMVESMYRHLLMNGAYISFPTFLRGIRFEEHQGPLPQLKYYELVRLYRELFGAANVRVFCYEKLRDEPELFLKEFCAFLGEDVDIPRSVPVENQSLSNPALLVKRLLNRMLPHGLGMPPFCPGRRPRGEPVDPSNAKHRVRYLSNSMVRRLDRLIPRAMHYPLVFSKEWLSYLEEYYGPSNRLLTSTTGSDVQKYAYPGTKHLDSR